LRRILPILFFILLTTIHSKGQSSGNNPSTDGISRIVKLYPNPATSYVTFDLQQGYERGMSIQIYSFLGKKMLDRPNVPQKVTVELNDFNRGLYMYHLLDASGKIIESGKFQVTK
jgi:hypothetical protein